MNDRDRGRQYYESHKEERRTYQRAYYAEHRERRAEYQRKRRAQLKRLAAEREARELRLRILDTGRVT